jgi:hypothetical protein
MASRKAASKAAAQGAAAKGAPQEGPLCRVFGVRHLSPMGAHHLAKYLDEVDPTAVLVEGPSDATEHVVHLVHKKTRPPVALLAFTKERPVRSILFPLAEYSPEWVALTWALKKKRLARFIDLPAETFLARQAIAEAEAQAAAQEPDEEDGEEPETTEESSAPPTDTEVYLADPYAAIAKLTGEPDHDTWWEKHFEHTTAEHAYRQAIFEFGSGLRSVDYESPRRREETLLREAFMRRAIRSAIAEGHDPEKVVVVCGAYHAPVLTAEEPTMTDAEHKALPRAPTVITLMPYSYYRLSAQSGYGAGNSAPQYFQALWEELRDGGSTERLAARFLAEVAGRLRKAGTIRSSAEVIEAVRLANAMAAIRGDAHAPTLRDLKDAAVTCLSHGDSTAIARWLDETAVGDSLGQVPPGVLRTSIQDDFYRLVKDLRLEEYLKDTKTAQPIKGSTSKEWLDLRQDRSQKSPDAAYRDRNRSIFLHRLTFLDIGFAALTESKREEAGTYKEFWKAKWEPKCEIELVENALRGDSIEIAAVRLFQEKLATMKSVADAATLTKDAVMCALPDAMDAALKRLQTLAVDDADFEALARADIQLAELTTYRDVRDFDPAPIKPLVEQLFLRGALVAHEASRCSAEAAEKVGPALAEMQRVLALGEDGTFEVDPVRWAGVLDAIADDELVHAHVAGVACALLLERGQMSDDVLDRRVAKRICPGADPGDGAAFFEGLATRNRYALLSKKKLWSAMSDFIESLDDDAFRRAVVALRRAFAAFESGEARKIAEILAEHWGGGGAALLQAIETKLDDADLQGTIETMASDLEGLEDLDL